MSSEEKIKRLFTKSDVTVNSKIDDKIISNAFTILEESEETKSFSAEPNIWRIIMRSRITKLAAAAAIIAIVVVGMHYLGVSPDGAGVVWADVLENMEAAQTVTFTLDAENYYETDGHFWMRPETMCTPWPSRKTEWLTGEIPR